MQESGLSPSEALLDQLQDIHGAAEPGWWPPAPGWWVLGAVVAVALILALLWAVRRLQEHLRRRRLLKELEGLADSFDPRTQGAAYLAALNRVFRVIALRAFPGSDCARLQGKDWVAFIRDRMPGDSDLESLGALESGPYRPSPEFDAAGLHLHARRWVAHYG